MTRAAQLPERIVWIGPDSRIVARGSIYRVVLGGHPQDDLYGRTAAELQERDERGLIPSAALWAVNDDLDAAPA